MDSDSKRTRENNPGVFKGKEVSQSLDLNPAELAKKKRQENQFLAMSVAPRLQEATARDKKINIYFKITSICMKTRGRDVEKKNAHRPCRRPLTCCRPIVKA